MVKDQADARGDWMNDGYWVPISGQADAAVEETEPAVAAGAAAEEAGEADIGSDDEPPKGGGPSEDGSYESELEQE